MNFFSLLVIFLLPFILFAQETGDSNLAKARKYPEHFLELNLSDFELVKFPTSICLLTHMSYLDVSGNSCSSLPDCLNPLAKLEKLNIHGENNFESFPTGITLLSALKWLSYST
jgi:hypothetical protein